MSLSTNFPTIKPTLLLDFANTKQLDPRITFTRASTATYYDGKTTAKAEENLLTYSQDFSNTSIWTRPGSGVTTTSNAAAAPDGTTTASRLQGTVSTWYMQQAAATTVGQTYTISAYVMSNTGVSQNFRLYGCGTVVSSDLTATTSWQRFSYTFTATSGTGHGLTRDSLGNSNDLLIWGVQLEQRSSVTAYTATTAAPITNYIPALQTAASGVARFDHAPAANPTTSVSAGESLGLLIEEQRTNLLTYSEQFDNTTWTSASVGASVVRNITVAPDGTQTADKLIITSGSTTNYLRQVMTISAITYTASVYAKAGEFNTVRLELGNLWSPVVNGVFNLSTGAVTSSQNCTTSITSVGNGWYRCVITSTVIPTAGSTGRIFIFAGNNGDVGITGNGFSGIYIWGAQLEAGAFATSYIPTTSAQVTRGAETATMSGTSFSTWWNQQAGSLYVEGDCPVDASNNDRTLSFINDNTTTNGYVVRFAGTTKNAQSYGSNAGTANQWVLSQGTNYSGLTAKMALGYAVNDVGFVVNSTVAGTDTSA